MKKKVILTITIIILLSASIIIVRKIVSIKPWNIEKQWADKSKGENETLVYDFINNKLSEDNYGIYTNYLDSITTGDTTRGHDVLSESEGLIMLYAVEAGNKKLFNKHYEIVKNTMINNDGLVAWRKNEKEKYKASSTVDDFRIVKALAYGYDRWGDYKYRKTAVNISKSIYENEIVNNRVIDFKDEYGKSKNTTICYLDLPTVKLLSKLYDKWDKVYTNSSELLAKAKISDEVPLYRKVYNNEKESFDEENNADTQLSLITLLNKVEANENARDTINWLRKQIDETGALFSSYDVKTGKPTSDIQSTAIYSIAAMIFNKTGDKIYYNKMITKLEAFQVKDINSEIYGSFGDVTTKKVYSFNNLTALLALQDRK